MTEQLDVLQVVEETPEKYTRAAELFERASKSLPKDENVHYLLALTYKRQGKTNEARTAFRKIRNPDANVVLQMALLSLQEKQFAQAEGELQQAWEMDETSYESCYNLLLTRLTLGKFDESVELIPKAIELATRQEQAGGPAKESKRFLQLLNALLSCTKKRGSDSLTAQLLTDITPQEEKQLLLLIRGLGEMDSVLSLLQALTRARPRSGPVREAFSEVALVHAKSLMDKGQWTEADVLLRPLSKERSVSKSVQVAMLNLLGCCACMIQDYPNGARFFNGALKLSGNDPRLHQNLALCYELQNDLVEAETHWNEYFDHLDRRVPAPPDTPTYLDDLAFEGLSRLSGRYSERERWQSALTYLKQAHRMRPDDDDTLERLFHLYNQVKKPKEAEKILNKLRQLRPDDPQLDLYELDMIEVRGLNDIEYLLTEIEVILHNHPDDARVEDRAIGMVGNVIPLMGNLCDQLTDQMSKVVDQVRNLPNYQINWSAVREVMRDLKKEFQKLRRITNKCLPLVRDDEHRRIIRDLVDHIEDKMEACRSMGT